MISSEAILGLPDYEISEIRSEGGSVRIAARYTGPVSCPHCGSMRLRKKDRYVREVRHESWGQRHCVLVLDACKFRCRDCLRYFRQRVPGLLPCQRATEPFRRSIFLRHWDGISRRVRRRASAAPVSPFNSAIAAAASIKLRRTALISGRRRTSISPMGGDSSNRAA